MVFQSYALWPHMTLEGEPGGATEDPQGRQGRADHAGSARRWTRSAWPTSRTATPTNSPAGSSSASPWPAPWSTRPSVLLLDEPLSNLDAKLREQARAWLKRLVLVVGHVDRGDAHDLLEALEPGAGLFAQLGVEVGQRLVEQQHPGA